MGGSRFTVRAGSDRVYWMNWHWPRIFWLAGFIQKVHCEKQAERQANRAAAKTVHGRETRQKRAYISTKMAELYELEMLGGKIGLIRGAKTAGRKTGKSAIIN
jgi:hypothetical protein